MKFHVHTPALRLPPILISVIFAFGLAEGESASPGPVRDQLTPLAGRSIVLSGRLGGKLDQCITNRIMLQPTAPMVELFLTRTNEIGGGAFKGEFLGKWLGGAALACRYRENSELQNRADNALQKVLNTVSTNGYISTYLVGQELRNWDVWIQKYVLLGLLAQYDQTSNRAYLDAATRSADYVLRGTGPGKLNIEEYGPPVHKGVCNFNILEPMALLYQRTGEKRFSDFCTYLIEAWSKPGKYSPRGLRLIEDAEEGVPPVEAEALHSYAAMACFEGLCELYRASGNERYLNATLKFAELIRQRELMVVGSMSNHELWCDGAFTQTELLEKPIETCATATWMKLCYQLLRLTGDPKWADFMEISLYNALLGAMAPDGEWWAYDSQLTGERVPSGLQGIDLSCCVSSAPRALMLTPAWAVMSGAADEVVVNLYSRGSATATLADGRKVKLVQEGDYPGTDLVTFSVQLYQASSFTLKLRIPEWSKQTMLKVNGQNIACTPGTYATITRTWQPNDTVSLQLDLRGRIIRAQGGAPQQAIMRGPIVLALDNRLTPEEDTTVWLIAQPLVYDNAWLQGKSAKVKAANTSQTDAGGYVLPKHNFPKPGESAYIQLKPVDAKPEGVWMAFEAPFLVRRSHFFQHKTKGLVMCDFSSAGNAWSETNLYRTWLPQPMFMGSLYPANTWKIMAGTNRPTVPGYIRAARKDAGG